MLAMDYFDALEVDEFCSESEKFSKFMGLSIYENLTEHDVAMQSIPLYCPEITAGKLRDFFRLGYLPTLMGGRRDLSISPNLIS